MPDTSGSFPEAEASRTIELVRAGFFVGRVQKIILEIADKPLAEAVVILREKIRKVEEHVILGGIDDPKRVGQTAKAFQIITHPDTKSLQPEGMEDSFYDQVIKVVKERVEVALDRVNFFQKHQGAYYPQDKISTIEARLEEFNEGGIDGAEYHWISSRIESTLLGLSKRKPRGLMSRAEKYAIADENRLYRRASNLRREAVYLRCKGYVLKILEEDQQLQNRNKFWVLNWNERRKLKTRGLKVLSYWANQCGMNRVHSYQRKYLKLRDQLENRFFQNRLAIGFGKQKTLA